MMESPPRQSVHHAESEPNPESHNYEILKDPETRIDYLALTDNLISKMIEQHTDVAIFLDKSARPVAWMVDELWDTLAPKYLNGESPQKPQIKFLNIDREQWGAIIGRSEDEVGGIKVENLPAERLEELKTLFMPIAGHSADGDTSLFTDKRVMVVDEVNVSGDTAEMAHRIMEKAFPDAEEIKKTYWMHGQVKRDPRSGVSVSTQMPIWYSDREVTGRLVGDRDTTKSNRSKSGRQKVGKYWLSTPFREPDVKGRQLKTEIEWMAEDLRNHNLIYIPATAWDDSIESIDNRLERINGISIEDFISLRRATGNNKAELNKLYTDFVHQSSI